MSSLQDSLTLQVRRHIDGPGTAPWARCGKRLSVQEDTPRLARAEVCWGRCHTGIRAHADTLFRGADTGA
ncbi:hypothetical protein GCM10025876_23420 [Demequina litorisediminis]|uniref:Uncharacterized protein n=1 Tax=Demequina litorisediminis TaxID=1849022 RepID=A0ABQ6IHE0_9MICO|nr:hypothetical protein GCM10025876_23420 [Demequina litorisediminis]